MLRLYMHQASSRLACRDIQRIQRIQRIQLYSYTRYTAYSTIQPPSGGRGKRIVFTLFTQFRGRLSEYMYSGIIQVFRS